MNFSNKIRESVFDRIYQTLCLILTIIWIFAAFIPVYWLVTSTVKDQVSIFKDPPDWVPRVPINYVIQVQYDKSFWNAQQEEFNIEPVTNKKSRYRKQTFGQDAAIISWSIYEQFKNIQVGCVTVEAIVDGKVVCYSELPLRNYKVPRDQIWSSNQVTEKEILNRYMIAWQFMDVKKVNRRAEKYDNDNNEATNMILQYLQSLHLIQGNISSVSSKVSFRNLTDNYVAAWKYPERIAGALGFGMYMKNSLFISTMSIMIQWIISGMAAYALSRMLKGSIANLLTIFFLTTLMVPGVVSLVPQYLLIEKMGLINTLWAVIVPSIPNAFCVYLFKGFFDALPQETFDSGKVDGASDFRMFKELVLPMSYSVFGVIAMLLFLASWNDFFWPYLVLKEENNFTFNLIIQKLSTVAGGQYIDYPVTLSMAVISSIPTLMVFALFQKQLERGLIWSGIKG